MKPRTRRKTARGRQARSSPPRSSSQPPSGGPTGARESPRGRGRGPSARSIGGYLIERLRALGVNDIFGIPGDFVLGLYGMLERSPIRIVGTCSELNAGYAADAYARINGIGAVCVTYSVGGLSLINAIAGAYAEKSPVIVISGAPGVEERADNLLLHHRVGAFSTQREIFERITVAATCLDDPLTAFREIDRCLGAAVAHKRPVYIELPRDRVDDGAALSRRGAYRAATKQRGGARRSAGRSERACSAAPASP